MSCLLRARRVAILIEGGNQKQDVSKRLLQPWWLMTLSPPTQAHLSATTLHLHRRSFVACYRGEGRGDGVLCLSSVP